MNKNIGRIPAVDGLRGVAILLVIYQHSIATAVGKLSMEKLGLKFPYLTGNAWMGVSLFFILSGFVLALPYLNGERQMRNQYEALGFYKHRSLRLLPLFIFMAVVSYAFGVANGQHNYRSLLLAVTTGSMLTKSEFFPTINGPFWSLAIEIWFSVALPLVLWLFSRYGFWRVTFAILVTSLLIRVPGAYFPFDAIHQNPLKDSFLARMDDFLIGMAIAKVYVEGRVPKATIPILTVSVLSLVVAALLWDLRLQGRIPVVISAGLNNLTQLGFAGLLCVALQSQTLVSRALSAWWLRMLGAMCFSIYCWHGLLIRPDLLRDPFNPLLLSEFAFVLLALSAFTYRYIEFAGARSTREVFLLAGKAPGKVLASAKTRQDVA